MGELVRDRKIDPREAALRKRLPELGVVLPVVSSKGGVGKSLLSTTMALLLSRRGYSTGLLDLDFHNPSVHLILGKRGEPLEERGLIPPDVEGVKFLSVVHFSGDLPLLLRKEGITSSLLDLLSLTRWGRLDYLLIDMPPGSGDELLEVLRLLKGAEFLVVTTPSKLSRKSVERMIEGLKGAGGRIAGIVENFSSSPSQWEGVRLLGWIRYDPEVEEALGNVKRLLGTSFASDVGKVVEEYLKG
ncbi:MAG: P-loop NTPase [Candidatus Hadarchaeales archaeon]